MANLFLDLPVPAGNGTGAPVDVSALGRVKTITVQGDLKGTITIEFSEDGSDYFPLKSFAGKGKISKAFAAQYMRVRVSGYKTGTGNVDVGSDDIGQQFLAIPAPAGDGVGAAVDVSALGTLNTFAIAGDFSGTVTIEISEDNVDWAQCASFSDPGHETVEVVARYMRVRRDGVDPNNPGSASVALGAVNDAAGAAAGASFLGYFGDGSDGDVVLSGDETSRVEAWYNNLDTNGFDVRFINRLFVRDTLIVRAGSHISQSGADGVGTSGGAQRLATVTGTGGGGGNEQVNGIAVTTHGYGGDGGNGGASPGPNAPGSGGASSGGDSVQQTQPRQCHEIVTARTTGRFSGPGYERWGGGGGGGGGEGTGAEPPGDQDGGGGGAGGDVLVVSARNIIIEAGGYIEANGGDGADGETVINPLTLGTGGGGGGGGGLVLLCYESLVNNGTIQAAGGSGGSGSGLGSDGEDGEDGNVFQLQTIE